MRQYDRLAKWVSGVSYGLLAFGIALGLLTKVPLLPLLFLALAGIFASQAYFQHQPKLTPEQKKEWLVKAVHFYRELGFFSEYGDLTDDKLATKLNSQYRRRMGESLDPTGPIPDLTLLEFDKSRLWLSDLECDVMPENQVYARIVKRLGEISRGAFQPTDISENWESDKGPIRVEFTLNGARHSFQPKYREDWMDTDFVFWIAKLFQDSEYKLAICPGNPITAAFLTLEERDRIKKERGLFFGMPSR